MPVARANGREPLAGAVAGAVVVSVEATAVAVLVLCCVCGLVVCVACRGNDDRIDGGHERIVVVMMMMMVMTVVTVTTTVMNPSCGGVQGVGTAQWAL